MTVEQERLCLLQQYEKSLRVEGYENIAGVDEVGRGPYAGDVYAAAVILPPDCVIDGINDSKKLSAKRRRGLSALIESAALSYSIGIATVEEIDRLNILHAARLAMKRAVEGLDRAPDMTLVDGNFAIDIDTPQQCVVKGDQRCITIAAASILAKVARDAYMSRMAEVYPQYGFEKHAGYPTPRHRQAILEHGLCELHRRSFKYDLKDVL